MIVAITKFDDVPPGANIHEAGDSVVMPGLVDTHVHINEPGRTEWEGFTSATRAAAAGGITTIIEMPLNSIPAATLPPRCARKLPQPRENSAWMWVFGAAWSRAMLTSSRRFGKRAPSASNVFSFPAASTNFQASTPEDLREALAHAGSHCARRLLAHAELPGPIDRAAKESAKGPAQSPRKHSAWLASRPREAENEAIALLVSCAREFKTRIHIVHVSSSDALPLLRQAHADKLAITSETCPHYLTFSSEEIPDAATEFKCAPPIRERENNENLWQALGDGTIDMIATDHSPCPPAMKLPAEGDFLRAWGGIASLQLSLAAVWTQARARGYSVAHMANWLCTNPARLAGIENRKGSIAVGCDADIAIWNPDATFTVDPERLHHRHKITPYAGRELHGVVETTFLRGRAVFDRGEFPSLPHGQVLLRGKL